jgi:prepilin-type processing-associated H-X9-DG protein
MFANVVFPYIKNTDVGYCPEAGKTKWNTAIPGLTGAAYDARMESNGAYYGSFAQQAVNLMIIEWHPQTVWTRPPSGPIGQMAAWARPAELVLNTGDSVWDTGGVSTSASVGNVAVWPYNPSGINRGCRNMGGPAGWTWYIHKGSSRSGDPSSTASYDGGINSGMANVAFCDGHVKPFKFTQLERCDFNTQANLWLWTYWDPRY